MNRKQLADIIFSKLVKNKEILAKQFQDSKNEIGFFYIDDLLPEEVALQINESFPKASEMVLKKSIREDKFVAAQILYPHYSCNQF